MICQTAFTTKEYLDFETTTQVSISTPLEIIPPALSVCFSPTEIFMADRLDKKERKHFDDANCGDETRITNQSECYRILHNLKESTLFTNLTINLTDATTFLSLEDKTNEMIVEYYKLGLKCIKLSRFKDTDKLLTAGEMDDMKPYPGKLLLVATFNRSVIINPTLTLAIAVHESSKLSHFREGNMILAIVKTSVQNLFLFDFEDIKSKFLRHPFESNCIDYSKLRYESRSDCIEHCYDNDMRTKYNIKGFMTTSNFNQLNFPISEHKPDVDSDKKCNEQCRKDCTTIEYFTNPLEKYWIQAIELKFRLLLFSTRPSTSIVMIAAFDLNSYIIYIASIAGLWFGCCIFITVNDLIKILFVAVNMLTQYKD